MSKLDDVLHHISTIMPGFEVRSEQREMMEAVYQSMVNGEKAAVHAPTGTGKSLGYIIPAIAMKLENPHFKLTISTHTIALQDQLKKDLFMATKIYKSLSGKSLTYIIMKGKGNYLCMRNFDSSKEKLPSQTVTKILDKYPKLVESSVPLDRQHMGFPIPDSQWPLMNVDYCEGSTCPFANECTYYNHHMNLDELDIIVATHHLYLSRHYHVIDGWKHVDFTIFDEAHKLEPVLLQSLTYRLSLQDLKNHLFSAVNLIQKHDIPQELANDIIQKFLLNNDNIRKFQEYSQNQALRYERGSSLLLSDQHEQFRFKELLHELANWHKELYRYISKEILNDKVRKRKNYPLIREAFSNWTSNLMGFSEFTHSYFSKGGIPWISTDGANDTIFHVSPCSTTSVSTPFIRPLLLTSGTLAIGNSCNPIASRLGIELEHELILRTPFDLKNQSMVYTSTVLNPKEKTYPIDLNTEIFHLLKAGDLKTFILFTSLQQMRESYLSLNKKIQALGTNHAKEVEVWLQDEYNANQVLESFRNPRVLSVLFGTLKYFEGIDLKGDSLTQVILTKLPFSRPNDPFQRILNQTSSYSNWEAVIRLEQAYGRLTRTQNDYGSFAILDNRVNNTFFNSFLNQFKQNNVSITQDVLEIEQFHKKHRRPQ